MTNNSAGDAVPENEIIYTLELKRSLKPYKNHHGIADDLAAVAKILKVNPYAGDAYGKGVYKIRIGDEKGNRGKRGAFRLMYYNVVETGQGIKVYLITVFAKSDLHTIEKPLAIDIAKAAFLEMTEQTKK
jgi:hypothetical protein